jgi:hypothetical protein
MDYGGIEKSCDARLLINTNLLSMHATSRHVTRERPSLRWLFLLFVWSSTFANVFSVCAEHNRICLLMYTNRPIVNIYSLSFTERDDVKL